MQQAQQREASEHISWARAMIFGVGFFFISAILIGQLPSYVNYVLTLASLEGMEQASLALGAVCLGVFAIILVIELLFDPKPVVPPRIFTLIGLPLSLGGLALMLVSVLTGCSAKQPTCNQYFPTSTTVWNPLLGGKVLWFQPNAVDFLMLGVVILGVGVAMVFYSVLALREQGNPDRHDLGTTPAIRGMIIVGTMLLIIFLVFYTYVNDQGLAAQLFPGNLLWGQKIVDLILATILGLAIFLTLGAFALRLHYLMRPVRKRTMAALYAVGSLGLAQTGAIFLLLWFFIYPLIGWIHSWTFIGLGTYLTVCGRASAIPATCSFSQQAGYIANAIVTGNFFVLLLAAVAAWKTRRNLVIVGSVVITAVLALATLLVHMHPDELLIAMLLCGAGLVLAAVWTSVARREFAVVGENRVGCVGLWLIFGTCLLIYLASFAFFSLPSFHETETNIPFISGLNVPAPPPIGQPPSIGQADAIAALVVLGILASIQFFFLTRNRYKV